jgi:hypothetical protein
MDAINFDEASQEWRKNKIYFKKGYFKYKCEIENCNEILYSYTTEHKQFKLFATSDDLKNKNNPNKYRFCEDHLHTNN